MELEGKLKSFSLPEVLQFLSMGKMTGTLTIRHHNHKVALLIKEGKIINVTQVRVRKIGQMLVESGIVKRKDVEEAIDFQRQMGQDMMLGHVLIERNFITREQLSQMLRLQIEEEIWDLFSWDEGDFKFEYGIDSRFDDKMVDIDIQPLLLEGTRRQDEWNKIKKIIPDEKAIVKIIPPQIDFSFDLDLTQNEWRVLSLIDGHVSISTLCNRSGLGRFDTFRILNSFLSYAIIELCTSQQELDSIVSKEKEELKNLPVILPVQPNSTQSDATSGDSQTNTDTAYRKKKLTSLFSAKRPPEKERIKTTLQFITPLESVSFLLNRFLATILRQPEFSDIAEDSYFLFRLWKPISDDFPRADLVKVRINQIDVSSFERYAEEMEMGTEMTSCYEESLEALIRFFQILFQLSSQRLGAKNAQKVWENVSDPEGLILNTRYMSEWKPQDHLSNILFTTT